MSERVDVQQLRDHRQMTPEVAARFWTKVLFAERDECWLWQAYTTPTGYGKFKFGRDTRAHRVAYEALVGPIPEGLQIDHLCRNRACVNPAHMEAVTQRENILRGTSPSALHAKKTHCPYGHAYTGENLYVSTAGCRSCRACNRRKAAERSRRARLREGEA